MIKKKFKINDQDIEFRELTVGEMRKAKKILIDDEFEAGLYMMKKSANKNDEWLDSVCMSELNAVGDWLANPVE